MNGKVQCRECGEWFNVITVKHLQKKHGIDMDEYKRRYGKDVPVVGEAARESMSEIKNKRLSKQRGIRLFMDLEDELLKEYEKEKERLKQKYGIRYSFNEFINHVIAKGLKSKKEEDLNV